MSLRRRGEGWRGRWLTLAVVAQSSVEDLQWSPAEPAVLASCSADRNICVWDARAGNTRPGAKILAAHDADVNVISWNKLVNYLLVSGAQMRALPARHLSRRAQTRPYAGGDDGIFRIWDLRTLRPSGEAPPPAAHFKVRQHAQPCRPSTKQEACCFSTTTRPSPRSSGALTTAHRWLWLERTTRFVTSGARLLFARTQTRLPQVTIWDMSVERDAEDEVRTDGTDRPTFG